MRPDGYICPICQSRALRFTNPTDAYYCPNCGIVSGQPMPYYARQALDLTTGWISFDTPEYLTNNQPAYERISALNICLNSDGELIKDVGRHDEDQLTINWLIFLVNREYGPTVRYGTMTPSRAG